MILKTFDTILSDLCDNFDQLITPMKLSRTNTNVIYLLFKAIAKGEEVINNVCVTLSHKFDPAYCSDEDLNSVSRLVGTKKLLGSSSGLKVTARNNGVEPLTLLIGFYKYELDKDIVFIHENKENVVVQPGEITSQFFFSKEVGKYPITAQNKITITAYTKTEDSEGNEIETPIAIPSDFTFSCLGNDGLLGTSEETNNDFRERILTDTNRQGAISEMELAIKNLPYVFDCNVVFNQSPDPLVYDNYTIPSYHLLITMSGDKRDEIAKIVAQHGIYPTYQGEKATELRYVNDIFIPKSTGQKGYYPVYVHDYDVLEFKLQIKYDIDEAYTTFDKVKPIIESAVLAANENVHRDLVSEDKYYNIINNLHLVGFKLLCVNLQTKDGSHIDYLEVPKTRIAELVTPIVWQKGSVE